MKLRPSVRVPIDNCPHCGTRQDGASGVSAMIPQPNDITVCIQCGGVSVFNSKLKRKPWPKSAPLPADVKELQIRIRQLRS